MYRVTEKIDRASLVSGVQQIAEYSNHTVKHKCTNYNQKDWRIHVPKFKDFVSCCHTNRMWFCPGVPVHKGITRPRN